MSENGANRQRLAAILAADAAGYSRLMHIDEAATLAALDAARAAFRTCVETHHGRVIDMAGDSVLAIFEAATGAVSAALAVQSQLEEMAAGVPADRRLRFRIGVHMGDVTEKADGTVYGEGVNIAWNWKTWFAPEEVRSAVAWEWMNRSRSGKITSSSRNELVEFRQS